MTVIDVHAHHLPVALGERFTALSGIAHPLRHGDNQARRIAELDDAGIDAQILGLGAVQPYWPVRTASVDGAQFANDLYANIAASHGGRLRAFGAVPLPYADDASAEAIRCLDDLGFDGIGLGCSAQGVVLDDSRFEGFWAELDRRQAVVYLHPGVSNDGLVGVAEYPMLLGPVFGSPAEQAVAIARLVLAGIPRRYPHVRFVSASMGGSLLIALTKFADSLDRGKMHGETYDAEDTLNAIRSLWFDSASLDPVLTLAARSAGVLDRVVFGSDSPWGTPANVKRSLSQNLSPEEFDHVLEAASAVLLRPDGGKTL